MDVLEAASSITSLNGVEGLKGLAEGSQVEAELYKKGLAENEAVVFISRLLLRSKGTLKRLDLRYGYVI